MSAPIAIYVHLPWCVKKCPYCDFNSHTSPGRIPETEYVAALLADLDGIVIPGGFGDRGFEGKVAAAGYAREHDIPCLGLCLGLQAMTIDFARNVMGLVDANSTEMNPATTHPVIDLMHDQRIIRRNSEAPSDTRTAREHRHGHRDHRCLRFF